MNILIVDDREENRYLLESLLKGNGHDVRSAANGAEALEILQAGGVDLIISDILMPVMDGFQLCRKVKTDESLQGIPFIIYTATYTGPQDREFALKIGADRFIEKPCEPEVFMAAVNEVMAAAGLRGRPPAPTQVQEEEALRLYSERLVRKLEQKMLELEKEVEARREAEDILRASERKYRLLADNTLDVIWAMNLDLEFTYVNPAIFKVTGHTPEEWLGSRLQEHCDEANFTKIFDMVADEMAKGPDGAGVVLEAELLKKNGERIWVEVHGRVIYDDNRRPISLQGVARDITKRKESEKKLREAYDIINRSSSVAFTWKNQEAWPVEFVSENVERLFGYTAEKFIKGEVKYIDCIHPEDRERVAKEVAEFSSEAETTDFIHEPYRIIAKDGSEKIVRDWTFIVRDNDRRITHYQGIVEDITARKQAEEEQEKLQAQLLQAQKMESVGRLAGGVAHDFNNMLTVIIGNAELAQSRLKPDDPLYTTLDEILKAGRRSADLTRQLLAFARKQVIKPVVLDLNETVEGMLKMLRRLLGEDIDILWKPSAGLWPIRMDPAQVDQIMANLCVNARDAVVGQGRVIIETKNITFDDEYCDKHEGFHPGEFVMLAVSDDGVGMDRETLEKIFEPFFTTKKEGQGTGLGLSMIYGIVKQNEGFINVYSEPGRGTTFKIYLPRHEGVIRETRVQTVTEAMQGRGETVLLVEDESSILRLGQRILEKLGYKVLTADKPSEALQLARGHVDENEIALVLTDVIMPEMNGRELADRLRQIQPGIKCLFMSGYTANVIAHHGVIDEDVHFLEKPVSLLSVAKKVREVLDS